MPRVPLNEEMKARSGANYPRLMLEKDERARINVIEVDPLMEFVHTLRAPRVEHGEPVYQDGRDGKEEMVFDFIGRHICLGDFDTLTEKGLDPANCPACAAAKDSDAVRSPERRFGVHIIKYATQPGSFSIIEPFSFQMMVWVFGDNIFDKLVDIQKEWGSLQQHDLNLGPCTVKQFQKFEIQPASQAEWIKDQGRIETVKQTFTNSQCKDLAGMIGRKVDRRFFEADIEKCVDAYRQVFSKNKAAPVQLTVGGMDMGTTESQDETVPPDISSLLDTPTAAPPRPAQPAVDLSSLLDTPPAAAPSTPPANLMDTPSTPPATTPEEAPKTIAFDDLLN
jgi:hypothetical protein